MLAPTELDQDDDVRVAAAVKELQLAETDLVTARAAAAAAAADAPLGDANVHLAAMRAKLAMVEAFLNVPPTKTVVRTHAGYIGSEIEQVKAQMAELAPHIAEYKASRDALGCEKTPFLRRLKLKMMNVLPRQARDKHRESTQNRGCVFSCRETLGALDSFTAGLVGNQLKAASLRKIWSQVDADGSGDLDREEVRKALPVVAPFVFLFGRPSLVALFVFSMVVVFFPSLSLIS